MKRIFTLIALVISMTAANAQTNVLCEAFTTYGPDTLANATYNGWTISFFGSTSYYTSTTSSGVTGPNSYKFGVNGATAITPDISGADHINFWMKGNPGTSGMGASAFYIYESPDGTNYTLIDSVSPVPTVAAFKQYALSAGTSNVKFTYFKEFGNVAFDDFCATIGLVDNIEVVKNSIFAAYPNPSRGIINLNLTTNKNAIVTISNMIGMEVRRFAVRSTEPTSVIDLTELQDGIYFVKAKTDNGEQTERLVIRK